MKEIQEFISALGFPTFICVILMYALWKIYSAVVESLKHVTTVNEDLAKTNNKLADQINNKINNMENKIDKIADKLL